METHASGNLIPHDNDLNLIDSMDVANFEQFIELIRGEATEPMVNVSPNFDCEHISGCFDSYQFGPEQTIESFLVFNETTTLNPRPILDSLPGNIRGEEEDGKDSSAMTTIATTPRNRTTKTDRTSILTSERRRRGSMKEKLYALRSLVPNITKMDKASIVGDAVLYVQELQMQAKKLKAEIEGLESLTGVNKYPNGSVKPAKNVQATNLFTMCKKILQMDVFQVEERGFYVRLVCNRGQGVAVSLHKALESLTSSNIQSSNLSTVAENFILTFTLTLREGHMDLNLPNFKLWITGVLLEQGFEFATPLAACFNSMLTSTS